MNAATLAVPSSWNRATRERIMSEREGSKEEEEMQGRDRACRRYRIDQEQRMVVMIDCDIWIIENENGWAIF